MSESKDVIKPQAFTFETVAVVVAILKEKGHTLGMKDYQLMAELDGERTASGFDHMFRKVKTRANELLEAKGLKNPSPEKPGSKGAKTAAPNDEGKIVKKRGRKTDNDEIPSKKVRKEATGNGDDDDDDEF